MRNKFFIPEKEPEPVQSEPAPTSEPVQSEPTPMQEKPRKKKLKDFPLLSAYLNEQKITKPIKTPKPAEAHKPTEAPKQVESPKPKQDNLEQHRRRKEDDFNRLMELSKVKASITHERLKLSLERERFQRQRQQSKPKQESVSETQPPQKQAKQPEVQKTVFSPWSSAFSATQTKFF